MFGDEENAQPRSIRERLRSLHALAGPFPAKEPLDIPDEPSELFLRWLDAAISSGQSEPHTMTLSTVDAQGCPDARVVLLKDIDHDGWHFASTARGVKGRQILENANVALTFYWQPLGRQVRIRGVAQGMGQEASRADFLARALGSRAVALMDRQSEVLADLHDINDAFDREKQRLERDPGLVAPGWSAFAVKAREVEFWQGHEQRLHWRLKYELVSEASWSRTFLWP